MTVYKRKNVRGKTVLIHRWLMEQHIGRPLRKDEFVHHKNGDKLDNRLENLEVVSPGDHARHHNQKHPVTKLCETCGQEYRPHPTKRARSRTCSRPCFVEFCRRQAKNQWTTADPARREELKAAARKNGTAERGKYLVLFRWNREEAERLEAERVRAVVESVRSMDGAGATRRATDADALPEGETLQGPPTPRECHSRSVTVRDEPRHDATSATEIPESRGRP